VPVEEAEVNGCVAAGCGGKNRSVAEKQWSLAHRWLFAATLINAVDVVLILLQARPSSVLRSGGTARCRRGSPGAAPPARCCCAASA